MAKQSQAKVLRIGIVHENRIIEERLLRKPSDVTVGASPKCTFILPIPNLPESYRLFVYKRGRYYLRFTSKMVGRLAISDSLKNLDELRNHPSVEKSGDYYLLPLDDTCRGRLVFGDVSLLFQFVVPQPIPKLDLPATAKGGILSRIDTPLLWAFLVSLVLQLGGVGGIQVWWRSYGQFQTKKVRPYSQAFDLLKAQVEMRLAREEKKETPKEGAGGQGGEEGEVKQEKEEKPVASTRPTRTSGPAVESPEEQYRKKLAKVTNKTILRYLGAYGSGPNTVIGAGVEQGVATSRLTSAWETRGGVTVAKIGDAPAGFRAGPPGGGAGQATTYERLKGDEIGSGRPVAQVAGGERGEEIKVKIREGHLTDQAGLGRVDKAAVEDLFRKRLSAIRTCYEKRLRVNPDIEGKVVIRFTIGRAGTITQIEVIENTTGDPEVGTCIVQKVRMWRFTPPEEGEVTFSYPFLLHKG